MSTALPVISVIVPTRNNIRTIEACLASVRAQTHEAVELVDQHIWWAYEAIPRLHREH